MRLRAAASGFVVALLSVQVIQGQYGWGVTYSSTEICAVKGSTVDMSCTYTYPSWTYGGDTRVKETIWFTKLSGNQPLDMKADSDYQNRVEYSCSEKSCSLRIRDLRESDSAEYKFRFITNQPDGRYTGSPGVTLRVTDPDLQVQVSRSSYSGWRDLKCHSSCRLPDRSSYIWYRNGQKIPSQTSSTYSNFFNYADSISCAVEGHEDFPSPPVCVDGQTCNRVIYTDRSICAFKGSSVDISCTYSSYDTVRSKFWFSPERSHQWQSPSQPEDLSDSQFAGRVQVLEGWRGRSTLRITDLTESDSAEYKFMFITNQPGGRYTGSPGVTLRVTDLQVQVSRSLYYGWRDLKCHSSCRLPDRSSYIWYRNGQKIPSQTSSTYSVDFNYADSYSCAVEGHEDFPSPPVCVDGQTCNRVIYTDRSICASKGSSVDISCTYSSDEIIKSKFWFSPERSHQWQSPSQPEDLSVDSQFAGRVQVLESERRRPTLRIRDLTESDSARYHFTFNTTGSFEWRSSLPGTTLTVTALQVQVTRITVHQSDTEAELKCHSSCSPAARLSYVWFKNRQKVTGVETSSFKGRVYPGDIISCALKGHENYGSPPVYAPRLPSVSVSPSAEIVEGSSVTLTCSSDANPAANYTWYKKNGDPDLQPLSKDPQLVFSSIQSSDSGQYYCTAENQLGRRTSGYIYINVKYGPRLPSVSVSPSAEIVEGSSVTLTCSSDANPAANYTWYKENQTLIQGPEGFYHFSSISSEDRGNYYCKSENQYGEINSSSLFIDVLYAPKFPRVTHSAEIVEGNSVTLTCSSDANPAANYTWYKENQTLIQGPGGTYVFYSLSSKDNGIYHCKSENIYGWLNSTPVNMNVQYGPRLPSLSVSPSAEMMEGASVNLTCSSDANPAANYTWYKENEDSPKASGQIFTITDIRAEHSGNYYCEAQNRRGRHNSTLQLIVVSRSMKSVAAGSMTAILLVIICLFAFFLIRQKRSMKQKAEGPDNNAQPNVGPVYDNCSATAQRNPSEEQDDLNYATVSFSKNQEDPLYSNVGLANPKRQQHEEEEEEEDEDGVEYTFVNFKSSSSSPELRCQEVSVEDSSALYSTVTKTPRV
ncbi:hemicentin-1-like isoform X3 [Acanthopagrus latus]|uniref:hemicentin-1-like isoform X3 n=1 Tax=Acanthopagrus latus TaxID=8177 RepID=UPI00187C8DE6|nr:hemicentin-1-like isoform X3 [Acanthopagrus latus]